MFKVWDEYNTVYSCYLDFAYLELPFISKWKSDSCLKMEKKGKRKVQWVPQSQAAALPRHQEEEETDKTKQAQIEQTFEKH